MQCKPCPASCRDQTERDDVQADHGFTQLSKLPQITRDGIPVIGRKVLDGLVPKAVQLIPGQNGG